MSLPKADQRRYDVTLDALTVHPIEDRRSLVSPWGKGNSKIGPGIYTYSKLPGRQSGTCPGSSAECEMICYAKRVIMNKPVWELWERNTVRGENLPDLPNDAKIVRFHISGDFDTWQYTRAWVMMCEDIPDVQFFGYTRSWRVPELLPMLEKLRALPNVELWASLDKSMIDLPPAGWRRAWLEGDPRIVQQGKSYLVEGTPAIICPEGPAPRMRTEL